MLLSNMIIPLSIFVKTIIPSIKATGSIVLSQKITRGAFYQEENNLYFDANANKQTLKNT